MPEVAVPSLPTDPALRPAFLRSLPFVQRVAVTDADRQRSHSYQAAALRKQQQSVAATFDQYLASLEQKVEIAPLNRNTLARAAQMCQRTNQFNLTTKRYTVADLEAMMADPQFEVFTLSVRDRFEDSGITGLAILKYAADQAEIDTLLLSCRVLGRKIEDALLAFLVVRAKQNGAQRLIGVYCPTAKNRQTAAFYSDQGFSDEGERGFELRLVDPSVRLPVPPPQIALNASRQAS